MLGGTNVEDAGVFHLSSLSRLSRLGLCGCRISDRCLEYLKHLPSLAHLDLRSTEISDVGCKSLKSYKSETTISPSTVLLTLSMYCRHLTWLSLQFARVSDHGMEFIGGIATLKNFYLYGIRYTNTTLRHLSRATQLKKLELPCTSISDEGMQFITPLTNLTHLRLNNTCVTDRGASYVTSLHKLEKLDLAFSHVTRKCKEWIASHSSSLTVY